MSSTVRNRTEWERLRSPIAQRLYHPRYKSRLVDRLVSPNTWTTWPSLCQLCAASIPSFLPSLLFPDFCSRPLSRMPNVSSLQTRLHRYGEPLEMDSAELLALHLPAVMSWIFSRRRFSWDSALPRSWYSSSNDRCVGSENSKYPSVRLSQLRSAHLKHRSRCILQKMLRFLGRGTHTALDSTAGMSEGDFVSHCGPNSPCLKIIRYGWQ